MNNIEHSCSNTQLGARCYDEMESAGEILKVCREAKGLSLDDVSEELKILKRNLSLLEHDQAHLELSLVFAKGYLKNYAQFLGLDVKMLESKWQLPSQEVEEEPASTPSEKSTSDNKLSGFFQRKKHRSNHKAYYGVVAVVLMMGAALWLNSDPVLSPSAQPNQVTVETPKGITTELLASTELLSSELENRAENAPQTTIAAYEMTDSERADLVARLRQDYADSSDYAKNAGYVKNAGYAESPEDKPLAAVVSYSADALNQQDETILRAGETGISTMLTPESQSELSFFFSDDCWIKIVDGQNRIVYEAVAKQNESLELEGTPPFKVTLGYAPAVQVSYNGEPVEINTRQGRNVARIVLGS